MTDGLIENRFDFAGTGSACDICRNRFCLAERKFPCSHCSLNAVRIVERKSVNKQAYTVECAKLFAPLTNTPDPLIAFLSCAVDHDIPPVDAIYYWLRTGGKGSIWFKTGLRMQQKLLGVLVQKPDYLMRFAPETLIYLEKLSRQY